jgi:hypothetical protein
MVYGLPIHHPMNIAFPDHLVKDFIIALWRFIDIIARWHRTGAPWSSLARVGSERFIGVFLTAGCARLIWME